MGLGRVFIRSFISLVVALSMVTPKAYADGAGFVYDNNLLGQVERSIHIQSQASDETAKRTYELSAKLADIAITDVRFYSQIISQGGSVVPIAAVQGEITGTFTEEEVIRIGHKLLKDRSSAVFYTTPERANEAAAFKLMFEKQLNPDGTRKKITIVTIDERYQKQLAEDAKIQQMNILKRFAYRTREGFQEGGEFMSTLIKKGPTQAIKNTDAYKITRAQLTPSTSQEKRNAIKWGAVSVGVNTAMFLTFGNVDASLAISTTILNTAISFFLAYNEVKISNLFKAHLFREFRFAPEKRRSLEQLVVLTSMQNVVGLNGGAGNIDIAITPEAIAAGLATQHGQNTLEREVQNAIKDQAAERIVDYIKMMNIVLSSLATVGFVGFKLDATFAEVSALQFFIVGANLGLHYAVKKYNTAIRNLGTFNLRIVTKQSFIRYRNMVVNSMRYLQLKVELEKGIARVNTGRSPADGPTSVYQASLGSLNGSTQKFTSDYFISKNVPRYSAPSCSMLFSR